METPIPLRSLLYLYPSLRPPSLTNKNSDYRLMSKSYRASQKSTKRRTIRCFTLLNRKLLRFNLLRPFRSLQDTPYVRKELLIVTVTLRTLLNFSRPGVRLWRSRERSAIRLTQQTHSSWVNGFKS